MSVSVFIPSHITGFFSIKNDKNPLKKGSCGAGVLIDKGVTTRIGSSNSDKEKIENNENIKNIENNKNYINNKNNENNFIKILINGKKDPKNEQITLKTIQIMEKQLNLKIKDTILIEHKIEVPIGAGFGTSASCALGTAMGISKHFNLNISKEKIEQIAHLTEVSLGSGLGDVLSQTSKGVIIREFPGAPGIGKTQTIKQISSVDTSENENENNNTAKKFEEFEDLIVLTKTFGEIDTSSIIQDPKHKANINKIGLAMQKKIKNSPTIENFMNCSYEFAIETNLMSKEVLKVIKYLNSYSIKASMAMLGNTVFAITNKEKLENIKNNDKSENIKKIENNKNNNIKLSDFEISKIDNHGIRIF